MSSLLERPPHTRNGERGAGAQGRGGGGGQVKPAERVRSVYDEINRDHFLTA